MTSRIDVAIVAYRRWDLTKSCLEHLARQTVPHRVFVCDNVCDEETAKRLADEYPDVTVVRQPRNMPYPVACNAAVAAGDADFVVMMNNDVDARPDFLEQLLAVLESDRRIGSVACMLLRPGERSIDSAGLVADPVLAGFPRFQGMSPEAATRERLVLTGPAGAAAAFRRQAWQAMGGLDEALPAYMEDFDLALRLRAAGWLSAFAERAVAVHIGSATFGQGSADQRYKLGFGRGYIIRRYGLLWSKLGIRTALTEVAVVTGDLLISRDAAALRGRVSGFRSASGLARRVMPPAEAIQQDIGILDSFRRRLAISVWPRSQGETDN